MRNLFLLLGLVGGLLGPALAYGQSTGSGSTTVHATISWKGYTEVISRSEKKQRVPSFEGAYQLPNEQVGLFSMRLNGAVTQGELLNAVYEPFSAADAKLLDASKLPAGPQPKLEQGTEMKLTVTRLVLQPIRRSPQSGQPEKLVSFDYSYTPDAARGTATTRYHAANSVLRSGDWYKMGVAESGVFKLDKAALRSIGLNPQNINPNQLKVYGNSAGMLPQPNAEFRPDDLAEAATMFVGNNGDDTFDDNEYFLFYSPGPHTWKAVNGNFQHINNLYTDTTYYFVTVGGTSGTPRRITTSNGPAAGPRTTNITTYTGHYVYEHDLVNILHSGRQWLGEGFNTSSNATRTFSFGGLTDMVPGSTVRVTSLVGANAYASSNFRITLSGTTLLPGSHSISARTTYPYDATVKLGIDYSGLPPYITHTGTLPAAPGTSLNVGVTFSSGDVQGSGYLDYIELSVERQLNLGSTPMEFRTLTNAFSSSLNNFILTNAVGATVWDVTNPRQPVIRPLTNGAFLASADTLREFVAFQTGGSFPGLIRSVGTNKVPNQNLHAAADGSTDLVIVTYPPFKAQAERLANHRRTNDNLKVVVATTTEVYNEYSSGGQDVTAIRDLMKQVYDRAPAGKIINLLLFGDASYDYKSDFNNSKDPALVPDWWKDRTPFRSDADFDAANQNYVPTYESRESQAPFNTGGSFGVSTFSSEDYYALLDDNEGEWAERTGVTEMFDIGVGRLPIRTPKGQPNSTAQAEQIVSKIIGYDGTPAYGKWRNRVTLVTDDGEGGLFVNNSSGAEAFATIVNNSHPEYNVHKVYLDMYPQVSVSAGQRSPQCNLAIDQSFEQGTLLLSYLGHGGPTALADEQIITSASVQSLLNTNNLPFLITGTCDFSTYDNPDQTSAGEQALTDNPTGGAIGLFTTTRVVDAYGNAALNRAFFLSVLQPVNGVMPRIGQVAIAAKNVSPSQGGGNINDRNYTLLADPSMRLAYPKQTVIIDSVDGHAVTASTPPNTLKALDRVRLHGRVLNGGALNATFNGKAQVTIYDKPTTVMTLGDEWDGVTAGSGDAPQAISVQESIVYGGQATVRNGQFSLTFVVPKDINYSVGSGKISLYAEDTGNRVDANGYQVVPVGGANLAAAIDTIPPKIQLFMDTESFVFGGLTAPTTTLLANLSDDSGINTTGAGIGHEITAVLDNDPSKLLVLNDSYVASLDNFKAGKVNNLYKTLSTGPHTLRLKAWDTYNNSAEREIEFVAATTEKLALDHVLNYPNPFANITTFHFDTNHPSEDLDVQVQIFTVSGKLVRTIRTTASAASHQSSISWNGRDEYDDQLARGVYVYRVSVRALLSGDVASKYEKLVILN